MKLCFIKSLHTPIQQSNFTYSTIRCKTIYMCVYVCMYIYEYIALQYVLTRIHTQKVTPQHSTEIKQAHFKKSVHTSTTGAVLFQKQVISYMPPLPCPLPTNTPHSSTRHIGLHFYKSLTFSNINIFLNNSLVPTT